MIRPNPSIEEHGAQPLVSVIMNCYNSEKYLREAIESVLAQTYQNWEIIFWDNQSTDTSAEIFKSYRNSRMKYFYAPEHTHLGQARNLAVRQATGDWCAFLDCDDIWHPKKLEIQLPLLEKDLNVVMIYAKCLTNKSQLKKNITSIKPLLKNQLDILLRYDIPMSSAMFRSSVTNHAEVRFSDNYALIEDKEFFLKVAQYGKMLKVNKPLSYWRVYRGSGTHTAFDGFAIENSKLLDDIKNGVITVAGESREEIIDALKQKINFQFAVGCWKNGNAAEARKYLNKSFRNIKTLLFYAVTFMPKGLYFLIAKNYLAFKEKHS